MKKIFILFSAMISAVCSIAQTITWSTPVPVAAGSTYGNMHPRITLGRSGNPIVLWGKSSNNAYCSRWTGSSFTTPVMVNSSSMPVFTATWAGPDIASYGDTVYVTLKKSPEDVNTNYSYLAHSYDGGATFSTPVRVDNINDSLSRFPIVTTTSDGNPMVAFMKFNSSFGGARYVVSRSTDYGASFTADSRTCSLTDSVCDCCPAALISSGTNAVMLYRANAANIRDIKAGISPDGGATFPTTTSVDNNNWMIMMCPPSGPDGFINGSSLYTVFMSAGSGTSLVYLNKSTISGTPSSVTSAITGTFSGLTLQNYPRITNLGSSAFVAWRQNTSSGNSIAYSFTYNIAGGFTGYNTLASGASLSNVDVAMAPGQIHVVYEDDNSGNVMYVKGTYPPVSVEELAGNTIEVFPNPAHGEISFTLSEGIKASKIFLTDAAGHSFEINPIVKGNTITSSVAHIAAGNYIVSVLSQSGSILNGKVVIE